MEYTYPSQDRKTKVTLTLSPWIVENLDKLPVKFKIKSRSELMENVLAEWLKIQAQNKLKEETAAYYSSLSDKGRAEDKAWSRLASKNAKNLWE